MMDVRREKAGPGKQAVVRFCGNSGAPTSAIRMLIHLICLLGMVDSGRYDNPEPESFGCVNASLSKRGISLILEKTDWRFIFHHAWSGLFTMTSTVSLRHLRAFITVAELGSVTRAADALYRAQSAITRSVHELETVIGESLFERKSSGMLLTVFGTTLLFRAKRAAQEFELARDEIYSKIKTPAGAMKTSILSMLFNERRLQIFVKLAESHHMPTVANA